MRGGSMIDDRKSRHIFDRQWQLVIRHTLIQYTIISNGCREGALCESVPGGISIGWVYHCLEVGFANTCLSNEFYETFP